MFWREEGDELNPRVVEESVDRGDAIGPDTGLIRDEPDSETLHKVNRVREQYIDPRPHDLTLLIDGSTAGGKENAREHSHDPPPTPPLSGLSLHRDSPRFSLCQSPPEMGIPGEVRPRPLSPNIGSPSGQVNEGACSSAYPSKAGACLRDPRATLS